LTWFFIKYGNTATNSLNGWANTGDMAEGLTTALDLQKPLVNDPCGQGAQMVLNFKNDLHIKKFKHFQIIY
jgi:hypothetical protein